MHQVLLLHPQPQFDQQLRTVFSGDALSVGVEAPRLSFNPALQGRHCDLNVLTRPECSLSQYFCCQESSHSPNEQLAVDKLANSHQIATNATLIGSTPTKPNSPPPPPTAASSEGAVQQHSSSPAAPDWCESLHEIFQNVGISCRVGAGRRHSCERDQSGETGGESEHTALCCRVRPAGG